MSHRAAQERKWSAYPAYKPSGVEWLGHVPEHWEAVSLRRLLRVSSGDMISVSDFREEGYPVYGGNGFRGYADRWNTEGNTIIIGRYGALCGNVRVTEKRIWATEHAFRVIPLVSFYPTFLAAVIETLDLNRLSARTAQPGLNSEMVRNNIVGIPPISEQKAIAAFLDRETARIDALIEKKRRQIELLQEKRSALISHAVTKGLDPNAPMKDSGIEWLGQIPAHWQAVRVRHVITRLEQGWSPQCEGREAGPDEWGIMKAGCANYGRFNEREHKALPGHVEPEKMYEIRPGDVLMSRACGTVSLVGSVAYVEHCRPKLLLCDKLFRLHANRNTCDPQYLYLALNSRSTRAQIEVSVSGADGLANNITQPTIKNMVIALPPLHEQRAIITNVRASRSTIDILVAKVERGVELLREHRAALISAAVTGKIKVSDE